MLYVSFPKMVGFLEWYNSGLFEERWDNIIGR